MKNGDVDCSALFGVPVWNPLEHGIRGVALMVPAHEYNRVAGNLAEALSVALQYVPLEGADADRVRELERAATIPGGSGEQAGAAGTTEAVDTVKGLLSQLTAEQRVELFGEYCRHCGCDDPRCQCDNDD